MDPDEFDAYMETLPPEERRQAMYDFGFQKMNYVPPTFQSAFGPELTQSEYDLGQYMQAPPSMDDGEIEPWSLDVAKDLANWQQDQGDLTADPIMAAYAGRGGFDPEAFAPIITPIGDPLDQSGMRYVQTMAQGAGGYESYLARKIMGDPQNGVPGLTPGAAIAAMWNEINAADSPDAPADVKATAESLKASLPPNMSTDPATGMPSFQAAQATGGDLTSPEGRSLATNQGAIFDTANNLFEKMTEDQPVGYVDPNTGLQYAGSTQEPSELAAHFAELGIPNPFESYTDPKYTQYELAPEHWQEREQRLEGLKGNIGDARDIVQQMRTTLPQLREAWEASQQRPEAPTMPDVNMPEADPEALARSAHVAASTAGPMVQEGGSLAHGLSNFGFNMGSGFVPPPAMDQPSPYEQRMEGYEAQARKEMAPGTSGDAPLAYGTVENQVRPFGVSIGVGGEPSYDEMVKQRAQDLYDAQYKKVSEAGQQNPYMIKEGDKVVGAYDFGGTKKEQDAMAKLMGIVAWGQGGGEGDVSDYSVTPYGQDFLGGYREAIGNAVDQVQDARNLYHQQSIYATPEESASIFEGARAYSMEQAGRTPMEDALMQRALGRATVNPYANYGY